LRAFSNFLERKKAELNEERELGLHDDEDDE
jgi:cbb3-type cytochrome oxidase subunit 3